MKTLLKEILKVGVLGLAIGTGVLGCLSDKKAEQEEQEIKRYDIKVSETSLTMINGRFIDYNGMNNESTFSISSHYSHGAVNTYYPANSKEINFQGNKYKVIEVTPEHLVIEK